VQPQLDCEGTSECDARAGFDGPSGVGAPVGLAAFEPLFPTAVVSPPAWVAANIPATFSSSASTDPYPGGAITGWKWNFGDGSPVVTAAAPTHTYASSGKDTITLTVQDEFGLQSAAASFPVTVLTEAEGRRKREEEEAAHRKREEEEAAHRKAEEEEAAARKRAEEEASAHKKAEEEAAARKKAEEEAARLKGTQGVLPFQAAVSPAARVAGSSLRVGRGGVVHISVSCPAGVVSCIGTLTLHAPASGPASHSRKSFTVTVSFNVPAGKVGTVTLHLPARGRTLLAHSHLLRAHVSIASHDPAGTTASTQASVTLRPAAAHH
jgi:PKD repeat protein